MHLEPGLAHLGNGAVQLGLGGLAHIVPQGPIRMLELENHGT
jgi:hypothetical protein